MFWADQVVKAVQGTGPQVINDSKTPSGLIHVGSLRGVIIHDVVYRLLKEAGCEATYLYGIDDYDPMDSQSFATNDAKRAYMGYPLCRIPSPEPGFSDYARYFASLFLDVFCQLGVYPKTYWMRDLYRSGQLDEAIERILLRADQVREIYLRVSGSKKDVEWYPFQVICPRCGKVGTTKVVAFDGKEVEYECLPDLVSWAQGCGERGKVAPFGGSGKLPWKLEWVAQWYVLGVTIEGCGKDLATSGGSRQVSEAIYREVFGRKPPLNIIYEFLNVGGHKMATSRGIGAAAHQVAEILPPELLRFLMVRPRPQQVIDFDPAGDTIPRLFDEYDRYAAAYFSHPVRLGGADPDTSRVFLLSQVAEKVPTEAHWPRFATVANWIQIPNVAPQVEAAKVKGQALTGADRAALVERTKFARLWLDRYAPEEAKFEVQPALPDAARALSKEQKELLRCLAEEMASSDREAEALQNRVFALGKELSLGSGPAFCAVYVALLGKPHGPRAGWLINALDKDFVIARFREAADTA